MTTTKRAATKRATAAAKTAKKAVAKRAAKKPSPTKPGPIIRKPDLGIPDAPMNSRDALPAMRVWSGAPRRCLQACRESWGLPMHFATAKAAREGSKSFHKWTGDVEDIPYGAPVFSRRPDAPADDAEHVFLAGGHSETGKRIFWSVDVIRLGDTDPVEISFFSEHWGHEILGWADDLNGFDLNLPQSPNERRRK